MFVELDWSISQKSENNDARPSSRREHGYTVSGKYSIDFVMHKKYQTPTDFYQKYNFTPIEQICMYKSVIIFHCIKLYWLFFIVIKLLKKKKKMLISFYQLKKEKQTKKKLISKTLDTNPRYPLYDCIKDKLLKLNKGCQTGDCG